MHRLLLRPLVLAASLAGLAAAPDTQADALSAVEVLRAGGCGGVLPRAQSLRHELVLDGAAEQWALGRSLEAALESARYRARSTAAVHITGPDSSTLQLLRQSSCRTVMSSSLSEIGVYRRGLDTWIVLASASLPSEAVAASAPAPALTRLPSSAPEPVPVPLSAPALAGRALQLVNNVRAHGTRCGEKLFAPAQPVMLSGTLAGVASAHAVDMADHGYFEHEDLNGHSPADRVRAVGYREKLVGENIAYGPETVDDVVRGWLDSPGHCENIMDPRFAEMGIGYATGRSSRRGLYWVQVLAAPRA
jgi:uncharacterized protein YkwD